MTAHRARLTEFDIRRLIKATDDDDRASAAHKLCRSIDRVDLDDADREAVRAQVKAVELAAERRLLAALEGLSPPPAGSPKPVLEALIAVSRQWSPMTPRPGLTALAERLPA